MECSCINLNNKGDYPQDEPLVLSRVQAKREELCDECFEEIGPGELFEKMIVVWAANAGKRETYRMCTDCQSLRTAFFCNGYIVNRMHEHLWEHVVDTDGEVDESCLSKLTPGALGMICEMIEEMWEGFPESLWSEML